MRVRKLIGIVGVAALAAGGPALLGASAGAAPAPAPAHRHAVAGDFDGDGVRDLALGAPGHDRVRVRYSHSGHVTFLHGNAISVGATRFGSALAVGDFNGDGYSDLAVGAPWFQPPHQTGGFEDNPETEGAIFEFDGSPTGLHARPLRITGPYDGDEPYNLGDILAAADVNGDGRTDIASTLYGADVEVQVFHGSSTGLGWTGEQDVDGGFDPTALAFGDVNGDHRPDLVVGAASDFNDDGSVRAFLTTHTGRVPAHPQWIRGLQVGVHNGLGSALATGDVNGDGIADVAVGASVNGPGSVVLLRGSHTGLSAAHRQRVTEPAVYRYSGRYDAFGAALALARVTGDRYADLVVGAPGARVGTHAHAGALYLLPGSAGGLRPTHRQRITQASAGVPGIPATNAYFGTTLYAAQLVGSTNADLAIGAPNGSYGAPGGGFVIRLRGAGGGLASSGAAIVGDGTPDDGLGQAIA